MQEKIKKFFNENNFLLWIKTNNYLETEKKLIKNFQFLENKKLYIYQNKITINQETGNKELNMNNLYNTLDELYPQGIRKKITILLVKESFEEILEKQNIDYIKEIIEIKKNNPNYNFKLIVISDNSVPEKLSNLVYFIDEKILTEENNVKEFILDFLKNEEAQLNTESINKIINILKDDIKKEGKEYNENKIIKNQFENMVVVEEGKYIPSFIDNEIKVSNIEVSKYLVTQDLWEEIMGYNPSYFKGGQKPVENVTWWDALKFCNKLSKKYGLEPVYDLNQDNILMINQLGKNKVEPDKADFGKTEGFRLPTEIEWEWFARGGQKALDNGTFDYKYSGSNNIDEVAWYKKNSFEKTHDVGLKNKNQLGIYDCCGNVCEWCFDIAPETINQDFDFNDIYNKTSFIYSANNFYRRLRGGSFFDDLDFIEVEGYSSLECFKYDATIGFRIVRTI